MSILGTGRAGLAQAMSAEDASTQLANARAREKAGIEIANRQQKSATQGQMTGLAGSAAVAYGPKLMSGLNSGSGMSGVGAPAASGSGDAAGGLAAVTNDTVTPIGMSNIPATQTGNVVSSMAADGSSTLGGAGNAAANTLLNGAAGQSSGLLSGAATQTGTGLASTAADGTATLGSSGTAAANSLLTGAAGEGGTAALASTGAEVGAEVGAEAGAAALGEAALAAVPVIGWIGAGGLLAYELFK